MPIIHRFRTVPTVPTLDSIIDALIARIESDAPDQTETEALEAALRPLEDYMASRDRMEIFIAIAEAAIDLRDEQAVAAFRAGGGEGTA